jgi:hypothetical protein
VVRGVWMRGKEHGGMAEGGLHEWWGPLFLGGSVCRRKLGEALAGRLEVCVGVEV